MFCPIRFITSNSDVGSDFYVFTGVLEIHVILAIHGDM